MTLTRSLTCSLLGSFSAQNDISEVTKSHPEGDDDI